MFFQKCWRYPKQKRMYRLNEDYNCCYFMFYTSQPNHLQQTSGAFLENKKSALFNYSARLWNNFSEQYTTAPPIKIQELKDNKDTLQGQQVDEILTYLNEKADKRLKLKNRTNRKLIGARLKEGYTVEDCKAVIDAQVALWLGDARMAIYLRPQTLFRPTNIETYLQNARAMQNENDQPSYRQPKDITLDFEEDF